MHRGDKILPRLISGFVGRLLGRAVDHDDAPARPQSRSVMAGQPPPLFELRYSSNSQESSAPLTY
jgi:hypothetical protein